jgi:hypothetical protein
VETPQQEAQSLAQATSSSLSAYFVAERTVETVASGLYSSWAEVFQPMAKKELDGHTPPKSLVAPVGGLPQNVDCPQD